MLQTASRDNQSVESEHVEPLKPLGATAALVHREAVARSGMPLVYIAATARRARDLQALLSALEPARSTALFVPLDTLPFDGTAPSASAMGRRMSVLRWLINREKRPAIVVTTAEAVIRRVPPLAIWQDLHREFRVGDQIDIEEVGEHLKRLGYVVDDRVDEPGEVAIRGQVIDLFPAAADLPCRIEHDEGRVTAIRAYDPVSQRTVVSSDMLIVDPASEIVNTESGDLTRITDQSMAEHYPGLDTLFDYLPDAAVLIEEGVRKHASDFIGSIKEAASDSDASGRNGSRPAKPDRTYMDLSEWESAIAPRLSATVADPRHDPGLYSVPAFVRERAPWEKLKVFAREHRNSGRRIVFSVPRKTLLRDWSKRVDRIAGEHVSGVTTWADVLAADPGSAFLAVLPLDEGFVSPDDNVTVVSARDVVGQRAGSKGETRVAALPLSESEFGIGDALVHLDHGVGILDGIDRIETNGIEQDVLRLRYSGGATLIVPVAEIGALWRYGSGSADITLDKLSGDGWIERRNTVLEQIRVTAERMADLAQKKAAKRVEPLQPDPQRYERFCARCRFELTTDQAATVEAVLNDLGSGRPMDRLICGDVGFGKTEVALRAAAAVAFSGRQVAVIAPTTVLAQQHFRLFQRRFAKMGIGVAQLTRVVKPAEAKVTKADLAAGKIQIVVGTHALLAKGIAFADLGLVVIDEEQRFGSAHKEKLRKLGAGAHVLAMTATPIPRTLQAGFVGLHELSIIATPPVLRQPISTLVAKFDDDVVRDVLTREKRRGGQSFVVCPRIEDIEPMTKRLARIVPALSVVVAHGKMAASDLDDVVLAFSEGTGDVLLATSIIESGLDIPAANTMVVWRPDRFGLAQLHQLRGRVGRGARRGMALLLTDPEQPMPEATLKRIRTLEALDRLGAGFDISARDLDARGAGDLLGDEQAGHLQLIGLSLYKHMLERALAVAQGQPVQDEWRPELAIGIAGLIPQAYVPEPEVRIGLYARLDRAIWAGESDTLEAEIEDRFGPIPDEMSAAIELVRLQLRCRELGVQKLDAGPAALAVTFHKQPSEEQRTALGAKSHLRWSNARLVFDWESEPGRDRLDALNDLLDTIDAVT